MKLTRRNFLKISTSTLLLSSLGISFETSKAGTIELKTKGAKEITTICPFCSVGCGIIVYVKGGRVIHAKGDPHSPINEGSLCPKGASIYLIANNPYRVKEPMYRAPGETQWEKISWEESLERIAKLVKKTRDDYFIGKNEEGQILNRVDAIAHVGSAALNVEECYMLQKLMRSLGLVYLEHQARI